jgi:hypothetical protein
MIDHPFDHPLDRLARLLSGSRSRRQALASLGVLVAARLHPAQAATQLEVAGCGAAGAVCTMIKGCCDGLVCATSMINPNYGVCISGEGDQVAVTSQLVVPESDGVMAQLAAELAEAEADGVEGAQVIEARQSAQDTRRSKHRTRKDAKRSKKRSRKDTQQASKRGETTTTCTGLQETCASADECCSTTADCLENSCGSRSGLVCCQPAGEACAEDCDCCDSNAVCETSVCSRK